MTGSVYDSKQNLIYPNIYYIPSRPASKGPIKNLIYPPIHYKIIIEKKLHIMLW